MEDKAKLILSTLKDIITSYEQRISDVDEQFESIDEEIMSLVAEKCKWVTSLGSDFEHHARNMTRSRVKHLSNQESYLSLNHSQMKHLSAFLSKPQARKRSESSWHKLLFQMEHTKKIAASSKDLYCPSLKINLPDDITVTMRTDDLMRKVYYGYPSIPFRPGTDWPLNLTTPLRKSDGTDVKPIAERPVKKFNRPWGIAVHPTRGNIYLTDQWNHRILAFNPELDLLWVVDKNESFGSMAYPCAICVSLDGRIAVADYDKRRILVFNEEGVLLNLIKTSSLLGDGIDAPFLLTFDTLGRLWLCLDKASSIPILDKEYNCIKKISINTLPNGKTAEPHGIVCTDQQDILVACKGSDEVLVFDEVTGELVQKIPITETDASGVNFLAYGPKGTFVLTNENGNRMELYDRTGAKLSSISVSKPLGAVFGLDGRFYLASTGTHTVSIY